MKNTKTNKAPSFGKLFTFKLIKTMLVTALIWGALILAVWQFLRATAFGYCSTQDVLWDLDSIYFNIIDIEIPEGAKDIEHKTQRIEDIAASISSSKPVSDDVPTPYGSDLPADVRFACAVYNAETGDPVYSPDTEGFTEEEIRILNYVAHEPSLWFSRSIQTTTLIDEVWEKKGGRFSASHVRFGFIRYDDDTLYAVKMIYTIDYTGLFGKITAIFAAVSGAFAVIIALISAAIAKKKTAALFSGSKTGSGDPVAEIRKSSEAPLNVILGTAESMRMAGDDRADNIIKNANLLKDLITRTENSNE